MKKNSRILDKNPGLSPTLTYFKRLARVSRETELLKRSQKHNQFHRKFLILLPCLVMNFTNLSAQDTQPTTKPAKELSTQPVPEPTLTPHEQYRRSQALKSEDSETTKTLRQISSKTLVEVNVSITPINFELDETFENKEFDVQLMLFDIKNEEGRWDYSQYTTTPMEKQEDGTYSQIIPLHDYEVVIRDPDYDFAQTGQNFSNNPIPRDKVSQDEEYYNWVKFLHLLSYSAITRDETNLKTNEREHQRSIYPDYLAEKQLESRFFEPEQYSHKKMLNTYHQSLTDSSPYLGRKDLRLLVQYYHMRINDSVTNEERQAFRDQNEAFYQSVSRETLDAIDDVSSQTLNVRILRPNGSPAAQDLVEIYLGREHLDAEYGPEMMIFGRSNGVWDRVRTNEEGIARFPYIPTKGIARVRGGVGTYLQTNSDIVDLGKKTGEVIVKLTSPDRVFKGFVFNDYEPVKNGTVILEDETGRSIGETTTDDHGQFSVVMLRSNPAKVKILTWEKDQGFIAHSLELDASEVAKPVHYLDLKTLEEDTVE